MNEDLDHGSVLPFLRFCHLFSDAPASLSLMIVCLTNSSKLKMVNFVCLTVLAPPLTYSIEHEYLSGLSGHSGQSGQFA